MGTSELSKCKYSDPLNGRQGIFIQNISTILASQTRISNVLTFFIDNFRVLQRVSQKSLRSVSTFIRRAFALLLSQHLDEDFLKKALKFSVIRQNFCTKMNIAEILE
jgi:hypothetical protein